MKIIINDGGFRVDGRFFPGSNGKSVEVDGGAAEFALKEKAATLPEPPEEKEKPEPSNKAKGAAPKTK